MQVNIGSGTRVPSVPATERRVIELRENGLTREEIAEKLDLSLSYVRRVIAAHIETTGRIYLRNDTPALRRALRILKLNGEGVGLDVLARRYKLAKSSIYRSLVIGRKIMAWRERNKTSRNQPDQHETSRESA